MRKPSGLLAIFVLLSACIASPDQSGPAPSAAAVEPRAPQTPRVLGETRIGTPVDCAEKVWPAFLSPGPQTYDVLPDISSSEGPVRPIRFGPIAGPYGKVYMFARLNDEKSCIERAVVFGSYEATTAFSRERGDIGPEERLFHTDLYSAKGHSTLGFYSKPPSYEVARDYALRVFGWRKE